MTILRKLAAPALATIIGLGTMATVVHAAPSHQMSFADRADRGDKGDKGDKGQHDQGDKGDNGDNGGPR